MVDGWKKGILTSVRQFKSNKTTLPGSGDSGGGGGGGTDGGDGKC